MKYILATLMLLQTGFTFAGVSFNTIAAHNRPQLGGEQYPLNSGQSFRLWVPLTIFSCTQVFDSTYNQVENTLNVFATPVSGVCIDPPPPITIPIAEIDGLDSGDYVINFYFVPSGQTFPPAPADYASYFTGTINVSVLASQVIDSTSNWSLILLISVLFFMGLIVVKKRNRI